MSFLGPLLLWGPLAAGAAAIPVALHFFYRSRYRVVPWAAMELLLASIQQTSRRLKFQEILLLLARVSLMLFLALAMMRPSCSSLTGHGRAEAVDAVLILDTSYSMGAKEGTQTRFEKAKDAARAVLDGLPPSSTVQIIAGADRAALLGPRSPGNLDQARQLIDALELTDLATDFEPAAREALDALKRGHAANREVYLFSDMQKLGWERQTAALQSAFDKLRREAKVYLVRCGDHPPRNAAVVGIVPQSHFPHTGERSTYVVQVRNTGREPIRDVNVTLELDGNAQDRDARSLDVIPPGETRNVPLTAKPTRAGMQVLSATLGADELAADNRFDQVVLVRDVVRVLVVDGAPGERASDDAGSFHLMAALQSIAQTQNNVVQPRLTTARLASAAHLADADVCVLVDVPLKASVVSAGSRLAPEFVERLAAFVKEGHGLIVFAGPRVDAQPYNEILFDQYGLLPCKLGKPYAVPPEQLVFFDPDSASKSGYLRAFREPKLDQIGLARVTGALDLEAPAADERDAATTAIRYTNGKPAVVTRAAGNGEVVLCTTTAGTLWTDWPKSIGHSYVPFVLETLKHLLQGPLAPHNRRAGEPLVWHPPAADEGQAHLMLTPKNEEIRLGLPQTGGPRAVVTAPAPERAGVYRITPVAGDDRVTRPEPEAKRDPSGGLFAVTPDPREGENLDALSDQEIDELLGFKPAHVDAGADPGAAATARTSGEWTVYILAGVALLALFETVFAWVCSRAW